MNHIEVKNIKPRYDYPEYYWIIDDKPITFYLDEFVRNKPVHSLTVFGSLYESVVEQYRNIKNNVFTFLLKQRKKWTDIRFYSFHFFATQDSALPPKLNLSHQFP